jgi:mono/diheme cytochrome c family protein
LAPEEAGEVVSLEEGRAVYEKHCLACHQIDGSGVPGFYPPLSQTEWVTGDKDRLIEIVLLGLSGTIDVNGELYNQEMASSEFLSDEEISAVLTYIRTGFGNDGDEVTPQEVSSMRTKLRRNDP